VQADIELLIRPGDRGEYEALLTALVAFISRVAHQMADGSDYSSNKFRGFWDYQEISRLTLSSRLNPARGRRCPRRARAGLEAAQLPL
jgi:hypothetical protein